MYCILWKKHIWNDKDCVITLSHWYSLANIFAHLPIMKCQQCQSIHDKCTVAYCIERESIEFWDSINGCIALNSVIYINRVRNLNWTNPFYGSVILLSIQCNTSKCIVFWILIRHLLLYYAYMLLNSISKPFFHRMYSGHCTLWNRYFEK